MINNNIPSERYLETIRKDFVRPRSGFVGAWGHMSKAVARMPLIKFWSEHFPSDLCFDGISSRSPDVPSHAAAIPWVAYTSPRPTIRPLRRAKSTRARRALDPDFRMRCPTTLLPVKPARNFGGRGLSHYARNITCVIQ